MSTTLDELVELLALEKLEENLFRGQSRDLGWGAVFGGQVLGQALSAAVQTVPRDRQAHSLHAYFLRTGNVNLPIVYEVDRIRDGKSFTTRRVVAIQAGQAIFNLAASFQVEEEGFTHQDEMPAAPPPDSLPTEAQRLGKHIERLPPLLRHRLETPGPLEIRSCDPQDDPFRPKPRPASRMVWMRATGTLADDAALHRYLLAYVSDLSFVSTALAPHGITWLTPGLQIASLDHVMWFHRPFRMDDWLLHVIDSPAAHGGRGLVRGRVFTSQGQLVSSTAQEGVMRMRKK